MIATILIWVAIGCFMYFGLNIHWFGALCWLMAAWGFLLSLDDDEKE